MRNNTTEANKTARKLLAENENSFLKHHLEQHTSRQDQVLAFHVLYDCPIHDGELTRGIDHMSTERIALRLGLNLEETKELFEDGFGITLDVKFKDDQGREYASIADALRETREMGKINMVEAMDALGDISYVSDGFALEMGGDLDEVVYEIHSSNMTKLGEDGKPIYREDGKVLKGPFYVKPDIEAVLF